MWVKTISGDLVNLANAEAVFLRPADAAGGDPNYYVCAAVVAGSILIYQGPKDVCEMVMRDIEEGIINGCILADLGNLETHGIKT